MKRAIIECFVLLAVGVGLLIAQRKVAQDAPSDHGPPASKDGTPCHCVWKGEDQYDDTEVVDESLLWQPNQYGVAFDTIEPTIDLSTDNSVAIDLGVLDNTTEIPRSAQKFYPSYPIYPSCASHRVVPAIHYSGNSWGVVALNTPNVVFRSLAENPVGENGCDNETLYFDGNGILSETPVVVDVCDEAGSGLNDVCEVSN